MPVSYEIQDVVFCVNSSFSLSLSCTQTGDGKQRSLKSRSFINGNFEHTGTFDLQPAPLFTSLQHFYSLSHTYVKTICGFRGSCMLELFLGEQQPGAVIVLSRHYSEVARFGIIVPVHRL